MNFKGKRVFISGGAGVIGKEMVQKLSAQGAVVIVGDLKSKPVEFSNEVIYRRGDLNFLTQQELDQYAPEYFFHLAATFERSEETFSFWDENFAHNVKLSHHLMGLMSRTPTLQRVIFASSYLIYDPKLYLFDQKPTQIISLNENHPILPRNLTGAAKLSHEIEIRFMSHFPQLKFSCVCARIYRGYGRGSRDIISRWIRSLQKNEEIQVYRKEGIFDYIYSEDSAEGLLRLAEKKNITGIINLGTGKSRSVADVVTVLRSHFPNMKVKEVESDLAFEASQSDMTLYKKEVDWIPQFSLETAIPKIIAYEEKHAQTKAVEEKSNILVTSASAKIPLIREVKKAIQKIGRDHLIFAGDTQEDCLAQYFVDQFWKMPRLDDLKVEALIEYCRKNSICLIIPTRDGELPYFAEHREALKSAGIQVMISSSEIVTKTLDKLKFYEDFKALNFPVIESSLSLDSLKSEFFVVKERFGAGSQDIGIKLKRDEAKAHASKLKSPLFQPFVDGKEVSVDAFVDRQGGVKGLILRTRDKVVRGESQVTTTFRDEKLEELCRRFLSTKGFYGHLVLQIFITTDGYEFIECNSRFGGASSLGIAAGVDSFFWFISESTGHEVKTSEFRPLAKPLKQVRFPDDLILHDSRL